MTTFRLRRSIASSAIVWLASTACGSAANDAGEAEAAVTDASPFDMRALDRSLFETGANTEGAVIQVNGKIVYERYAAGYDERKRHLAYSVSKSVGTALLGLAIEDGLVRLDDSVCRHIRPPPGADPSLCDATLGQLARMTSGLAWNESYEDPVASNVLPMIYGDEGDTAHYVALRPRAKPAGSTWHYSSGDSNLLAGAIHAALGSRDMGAWANARLFGPAKLASAIFEEDRAGTLLFASGVFMTPRDMARFGQLYLDDGYVGPHRVLPEGWTAFTKTPVPPRATPTPHTGTGLDERGGSYGASFWLNAATPDAPVDTLLYAGAPRDTYCAQGQWGQRICIVPSRKLVVVRVGNDRHGFYDVGPVVEAAVAAVDGSKEK